MSSSTPGQTNLGVAPNVGGLLCYIPFCCGIGLIFSIVVAIVEKQSRFLRFHAFQSMLLHAATVVLYVAFLIAQLVAGMISGILATVVWALSLLLGLGLVAVFVLLMIKANSGEEYELPVIGEMAKKWA